LFFAGIFLFLNFSYRNSPVYPPIIHRYAHYSTSYPQFKKVFSPFGQKIHTGLCTKNSVQIFCRDSKTTECGFGVFWGISRSKGRPATASGAAPALTHPRQEENYSVLRLFGRGGRIGLPPAVLTILPLLALWFRRIAVDPLLPRLVITVTGCCLPEPLTRTRAGRRSWCRRCNRRITI
jgi:hypothetical protein